MDEVQPKGLDQLVGQLRLTFRQNAVPLRTRSIYQKREQRHGASTLYLAKPSFNIAYLVCERRFAVC